jgi:hypothetical protein
MYPKSLALLILFVAAGVSAHGQSIARVNRPTSSDLRNDNLIAAKAVTALRRLESDVVVYRSLGEFEDNGRIARVSLETFRKDLQEVTCEVAPLLERLPENTLKMEIANALDSYRDGAFWWQKIDRPRVVPVSALASMNVTHASSETALLATVPYTVVIHWRQAAKYLRRAEAMMNTTRN